MANKRGLGRGLDILIPIVQPEDGRGQLKEVLIDEIRTGPGQPRRTVDSRKLEELADSIKEQGVIQPVVVRPLPEGGYELIAGERRWLACRALGMKKIPAVVRDYEDLEAAAVSLIENVQREELNPIEEAQAYKRLVEGFQLTQEEVARRVGKTRTSVTNMIRLLGLPEAVQELVAGNKLSAGHARSLAAVKDALSQVKLAQRAVAAGLSVRALEEEVRRHCEKKKKTIKKKRLEDNKLAGIAEITGKIMRAKVVIKGDFEKGKIEIRYNGREELERILEMLKKSGGGDVSRVT